MAATLLDDPVERPVDFDLAAFWAESSAAYERATPTIAVTVRIAEEHLPNLMDAIGRRAVEGAERLDEADPDGWVRLRLTLSWPDEVPGQLLSVGSKLEVLEPGELRDRIIRIAEQLVWRYRDSAPLTGR